MVFPWNGSLYLDYLPSRKTYKWVTIGVTFELLNQVTIQLYTLSSDANETLTISTVAALCGSALSLTMLVLTKCLGRWLLADSNPPIPDHEYKELPAGEVRNVGNDADDVDALMLSKVASLLTKKEETAAAAAAATSTQSTSPPLPPPQIIYATRDPAPLAD
eukprot:CAMPEP_0185763664 /NCGR_PEP_ID=MMETSP1174-20130828/22578_1 /TAXON_ID=35687 /ORGANISM="Dictyocha speculum, Strain CCMP1381" /LENGTH=161 /DNA_ID=CAMNT_0028445867 /DNA_START=177 /DNA_END=660 /DNA_ORIENTATION=+